MSRQLPHQVIGERTDRRERVLDGRQLFDLLRGARSVAVVQVVPEEVFIVLVVPGIGLVHCLLGLGFFRGGGGLGRLQFFGRNLLQHRVFDHFLVQQVRELQRRHRQQLNRLLERRRQYQLLNEFRVEFLLDAHEDARQLSRCRFVTCQLSALIDAGRVPRLAPSRMQFLCPF